MNILLFALLPLLPLAGGLPLFAEDSGGFEWNKESPELHGISQAQVESFTKEISSYPDIYAFALAKDGVLLHEWYAPGYGEATLFPVHSCSKSITGTLTGIALEQGLLKDMNQEVEGLLPSAAGKTFLQGKPGWPNVTLYHLLTNTSGVNMSDGNWREWRESDDWLEWIYSRRQVSRPGTVFNYATQNTHLLSVILEGASGMPLFDYAQKNLFQKIGIKDAVLGKDPQGRGDGGNGFLLTVRDMLRFGQLYLNGGTWQGKQVVPSEWVEQAGKVQVDRHGQGTANYGLQFWVRNFEGERVYFAWGWAGQFIFVIPSANATVVFTGNHTGTLRPYFSVVSAVVKSAR